MSYNKRGNSFERPKTSTVWKYYTSTDTGNLFTCNLCKNTLTIAHGSTGNLRRHMKLKHPHIYETLGTNESPKAATAKKSFRTTYTKENFGASSTNENFRATSIIENEMNKDSEAPVETVLEIQCSNSGDIPNDANQVRITQVQPSTTAFYLMGPIDAAKGKELDEQLLKIIVKHLHPLTIIENQHFISFVSMLNPNYTLPSYKMLSDDLLMQVYYSTRENVISSLRDATAIALTTDRWTSINDEDIITVTAHFLNKKLEFKSSMLDCICYSQKYNSSNVALFFNDVVTNWKISNKVVAVVTDNSECMAEAVKDCKWVHIPCFAHALNKAAKASLENIEHVLEKVRHLIVFLKKNLDAMSLFCAHQNEYGLANQKLKIDSPIRWNSTFDMLTRFLKNKAPIQSAIQDMRLDFEEISPSEWNILEKAVKLLIPLNGVTTELCSEKNAALSKVPHMTRFMMKHVKNIMEQRVPPEITNMGDTLHEELSEYLKIIEENDLITQSVLLDARLKRRGFPEGVAAKTAYLSLQKEIISLKKEKMSKSSQSSSHSETQNTKQSEYFIDMWSEFREQSNQSEINLTPAATVEIEAYLSEPYAEMKDTHLTYWAVTLNQNKFPTLFELLNKRFCIPATCVTPENLFTKAGNALLETRKLLISEKLKEILFLHKNF